MDNGPLIARALAEELRERYSEKCTHIITVEYKAEPHPRHFVIWHEGLVYYASADALNFNALIEANDLICRVQP